MAKNKKSYDYAEVGESSAMGFALRLKKAREKAGLSQQALASNVGVSATTIQKYEGGQFPKGEFAIALGKALGVNINWLLTGDIETRQPIPQSHLFDIERELNSIDDFNKHISAIEIEKKDLIESQNRLIKRLFSLINEVTDLKKDILKLKIELAKHDNRYKKIVIEELVETIRSSHEDVGGEPFTEEQLKRIEEELNKEDFSLLKTKRG